MGEIPDIADIAKPLRAEPLNNGAAKFGERRIHPFLAFNLPHWANRHEYGDARRPWKRRNLAISAR